MFVKFYSIKGFFDSVTNTRKHTLFETVINTDHIVSLTDASDYGYTLLEEYKRNPSSFPAGLKMDENTSFTHLALRSEHSSSLCVIGSLEEIEKKIRYSSTRQVLKG